MRKAIVFVAAMTLGLAGGYAIAQDPVVTGITPSLVGQPLNPATTYGELRANGTCLEVADGDTLTLDVTGSNRTYEFDNNASVTAGNVQVATDLTIADASLQLQNAINSDGPAPFYAMQVPLPTSNYYIAFAWKDETGGWGATTANAIDNACGGGKNIIRPGNAFNYQASQRTYFKLIGENLTRTNTTITLVSTVNPAVILPTVIPGGTGFQPVDGKSLYFHARMMRTTTLNPPLGTYDVVVAKTGSPTVTLPGGITLVENLVNDPTFYMQWLGTSNWIMWNGWNYALSPLWRNNNPPGAPDNTFDACRKGDIFVPPAPRQLPIPTAAASSNDIGDGEWGSLKWGDDSGRHQFWQYIDINFPSDTFVTLSGIWAGGTENAVVMTYGIEIRDVDENGAILDQTTPRTADAAFDWTEFSETLILPGGPRRVAIVVYGENSDANAAKGLHVDDLFLRVGADLWPDADKDGDVDQYDFGTFQACYTGSLVAPPALDASCKQFDRNGDDDIDQEDLTAFSLCITGPSLPLSAAAIPVGCSL